MTISPSDVQITKFSPSGHFTQNLDFSYGCELVIYIQLVHYQLFGIFTVLDRFSQFLGHFS